MRQPTRPLTIACFGEALWDILPRGIFLGGAPLNVAYHLSRQAVQPWMLTAVGRDFLGDEILRRMKDWGLSTRMVTRHARRPTGTVQASIDPRGVATFAIARDAAWDAIRLPSPLPRSAPRAIVYGTLALREATNRRSLTRLFAAWPTAWRVLDLNLRAPFASARVIDLALRRAQVLKLNETELGQLTRRPVGTVRAIEQATRQLAAARHLPRICVTAGHRGAGLWWDGSWHWEPGRRVVVRDTVGAGDAFLGAFLASLLTRGATPKASLATACRVGEFVAAHDGATPSYEVDRDGVPA
jgi:fructokinase